MAAPKRTSPSPSPSTPNTATAGPNKRGVQRVQENSDSDDDVVFVGTQRSKGKGKATARSRSTKTKNVPEYYPGSDDALSPEEEEEQAPRTRSTPRAATRNTRAKVGRGGRALPIVDEDESVEDFGAAMAAIPDDVDDSVDVDSTMKSSGRPAAKKTAVTRARAPSVTGSSRRSESVVPATATPSQATTSRSSAAARKRVRNDSDSDDDVAFKGFGGAKRGRR